MRGQNAACSKLAGKREEWNRNPDYGVSTPVCPANNPAKKFRGSLMRKIIDNNRYSIIEELATPSAQPYFMSMRVFLFHTVC
jgi:hypothetical protein